MTSASSSNAERSSRSLQERTSPSVAEVTEMIQGFGLAITLEATEAELQAAVFPHPTLSEAMHEASLDAYGKVLHL